MAQPAHILDRFGPYTLDRVGRRLFSGGQQVSLGGQPLALLLLLTEVPGALVHKDTVFSNLWPDTRVSDDSVFQVSARLRRALGKQANDGEYFETESGSGYRFVAPVERIQGAISPAGLAVGAVTIDPDGDLRTWAERHRRFLDGRSALERLDRHEVARARRAFEAVLTVNPHDALAHIGLAMAHLLHFESTRADATPDRDVLALAELHARHACRLEPRAGHAWRTLALVRHRVGDAWEATAAARRAVELDGSAWIHHFCLGFVSGGEERLQAALRVLDACPDLALAHWLAATVYVARRSFDRALDHARAGCVQQDALATGTARFPAVGLYLLLGMLLAVRDERTAAREALARELTFADSGHIYARESCANAHYVRGVLDLRDGHQAGAVASFNEAMRLVPGHPLAAIALHAAGGADRARPDQAGQAGRAGGAGGEASHDMVLVRAAAHVVAGRVDAAACLCAEALLRDDPSMPGGLWMLPIEPLLNTGANPEAWTVVHARLHARSV